MRDPLLAPLAAIAAGILVSRIAAFGIRELVTVIGALVFLGLVSLWRRSRRLAGACCLLALAFTGTFLETVHRPGPRPELDVQGREVVILAGCVVEPGAVEEDRERFVLELEPGARARVTFYARPGQSLPNLRYGETVEVDARVRRTRNFRNPGSFDYAGYLARRDIYWTASASRVQKLPGRCGSGLLGAVFALRTGALERIEKLFTNRPYESGMLQAILIGETARLERIWTEHFRSTGTFHALVISGTHVAVLAAFFLFLLRLCMLPRTAAVCLTVAAAWLYALITGWQPPVIRAAAGMTLFLAGGFFHRERRLINLIAAVAIVFLVLDPAQLFEASFQLSFLAVGFIAVFAVPLLEATSAPLARGLRELGDTGMDPHLPPRVAQFRVETRLLAETLSLLTRLPARWALAALGLGARLLFYVFELVLLSAVVQAGLALPMAIYFHRVSISGLSANAFVVPLMGLVVPAGFLAVLANWTWPAEIAAWMLRLSAAVVEWHAAWEPEWRIPSPPLWLAVALSAALIGAGFVFASKRAGRPGRWVASAAVLALLAVLVGHPFPPRTTPGSLEVTMIDVGQGECLLIGFPDGRVALADGGGLPSIGSGARRPARLDIGEDVVSPYLWSRSIRRVDLLILSHTHDDHMGGVPALIRNFGIREIWTGATPPSPQWEALRREALRRGVRILAPQGGQEFSYGGARLKVLAPPAGYTSESPHNNDSLVLRLAYGRHSFLLTGDIDRQVEEELGGSGSLEPASVLKVAHHGSRSSSSADFLNAVRPVFALVSAGLDNPYGNPHPAVVARMRERNTVLLRTDLWGLISIRSDGRRFHLETARWSDYRQGTETALDRLF